MLIGGLTERISVEINGIASTPLGWASSAPESQLESRAECRLPL